ncbi:uncharacterized protein [Drosophila bipectinata]|uniref:uncharacterized protein n=1 Tax=Drosophila bipectinata TaxID=42026 RepID=UPI0038B29182
MTTYVDYADQTEAMTKIFTDDHRTPVIATDLRHIRKLLTTLKFHHRATRRIHLIGTALKVIAGTPDFNDWEQLVCKTITVYPVQRHNRTLNFEGGNLVAEFPTRNLNIGDCKTTVGAAFCKELKNGTWAQQIVSGATAHCSTLPGHLDPITIVDHGTLIINDANVTVTDDQGRQPGLKTSWGAH